MYLPAGRQALGAELHSYRAGEAKQAAAPKPKHQPERLLLVTHT
jgi:hypothetical protein